MKQEFKIGDRVKLEKSSGVNKVGDIGVITEIDSEDSTYRVDCGNGNRCNWSYFEELELVEEGEKMKMTKEKALEKIEELKQYIETVETEEKDENKYEVFSDEGDWEDFEDWSLGLEFKDSDITPYIEECDDYYYSFKERTEGCFENELILVRLLK